MDLLPGIQATSSALTAQRARLNIVAQNLANAQTTRGPDGKAYQRQVVNFESMLIPTGGGGNATGVKLSEITTDETPGQKIYQPGHPHADEQGMVTMPNVQPSMEMVDMITASRVYEANLSVVRTARQMSQQTLAIGR